jgi:TM2 domain-containing membrane protein YozV
MNCANHTQTPATAFCRTCGKPLCAACQRVVNGVIFCEQCIAERLGAPPAPQPGAPAGAVPPIIPGAVPVGASTASPGLAALLGFIPGVGAIYNGQFVKGVAHVAIFIALVWAANRVDWFGLLIAFWVFYMVYDAYKTARARELGEALPDPFGFENLWEGGRRAYSSPHPTTAAPAAGFAPVSGPDAYAMGEAPPPPGVPLAEEPPSRPAAPIGAIVLIALGALFLINTVADFPLWWLNRYWVPAALIALGIWIFFRQRARPWACPCSRCLARYAMGPAMLITTGTLWLLDETTRWSFDRSWPIYLIVIGGILVMRHSASDEGHIPFADRASAMGRHIDGRWDRKRERFERRMGRFNERMNDMRDDVNSEVKTGTQPSSASDEVHNG